MAAAKLKIDLVTIFPAMFQGPLSESMIKRAVAEGLVQIEVTDLRRFAGGRHRQVDDIPYGGGYGMIFKPGPLFEAVEHLRLNSRSREPWVVLMTPQGSRFNQALAAGLAAREHLILLCGRYEGVDERVRRSLVDQEISIGDYILSGGEPAAVVVTDAVVRLLPGALEEGALKEESFSDGLLEYPQYTRPADFRGMKVPPVLLSGNHAEIALWRRRQALRRTWERRPDLLQTANLLPEERRYLEQLQREEEQE